MGMIESVFSNINPEMLCINAIIEAVFVDQTVSYMPMQYLFYVVFCGYIDNAPL